MNAPKLLFQHHILLTEFFLHLIKSTCTTSLSLAPALGPPSLPEGQGTPRQTHVKEQNHIQG